MKDEPKVVLFVNHEGATICVEIFQRLDATLRFEEFRRDPEDNAGWFAIGHNPNLVLADIKNAKDAAIQNIHWLDGF